MSQLSNITLRALEPNDLEFVFQVENNSLNWPVSSNNLPFSRDALERYILNAQQDIFSAGQFRFVIEVARQASGLLDVFDFDPKSLKAGVGIFIHPDFRNKGVGKAALELLKEIAREHWNIHQLFAHIGSDNAISYQLFKNSGFEEVGLLKDWEKRGNTFLDYHLMQWLADE